MLELGEGKDGILIDIDRSVQFFNMINHQEIRRKALLCRQLLHSLIQYDPTPTPEEDRRRLWRRRRLAELDATCRPGN